MLAIARERDLALGPAVAAAADIPGLPRSRRFARSVAGLDDVELLETLCKVFERSGESAAAGALRALLRTGVPAAALRRLARWLERRNDERLKLLGAIIYPLTMMVVGVVAFSVLLHGLLLPVVLNGFAALFEGLGAELPLLSRAFLWLYGIPWLMLTDPVSAIVYVAVVLALTAAIVWYAVRYPTIGLSFHLPLVRQYLQWEAASRFTSTLGLLIEHGIELSEATRLAAGSVANPKLAGMLSVLAERVESGESLVELLRTSNALPGSVTWRLRSAYYGNRFHEELDAIAATSRIELEAWEGRVRSSSTAIVQLVALIVLVPVALAVVAMYLPMFTMVAQIG
jgi:type IV pilus assembly protein PilC